MTSALGAAADRTCAKCPAMHFSNGTNAAHCERCPAGKFQNAPGQPNSQRVVATIYMGKPYKTCGQAGFRTAQDCLDGVDLDYDAPPSLVASVNEAINNGKLKERLLYWADHFEADWADDLAPAAGPANNAMTQLNSGLHGKVGSIEKWLLIVIVVLGAVCLLCCVCCIIHVGTCGIL